MLIERPIAFVDTETTDLNRLTRQIWEVGIIRREVDGTESEFSAYVYDVDLTDADPQSLAIGRFYDRHPRFLPPDAGAPPAEEQIRLAAQLARVVEQMLRGCLIVGAVPSFDEESLAAFLRANSLPCAWHYHLIDVETLAAGALGLRPPWDFDAVLSHFGLTYDETQRHTALGDARMARDLYDAVFASHGVRTAFREAAEQ